MVKFLQYQSDEGHEEYCFVICWNIVNISLSRLQLSAMLHDQYCFVSHIGIGASKPDRYQ